MTYTKHRDTDDVLEVLDQLEIDGHDPDVLSDENIYAKFKIEKDRFDNFKITKLKKVQIELWKLFDEPYSSKSAKVSITGADLFFWGWGEGDGGWGVKIGDRLDCRHRWPLCPVGAGGEASY